MERKKWFKIGASLTLASLAIACGGGGGGGSDGDSSPINSSQKVSTGTFVDASVQGITYQSGNLTGITDASGTFYYVPGETVTFSIGGLYLGESTGAEMVTPADLLGVDKTSNDDALVNMLRLLQTLDTDGNPDNGIAIPEGLINNLEDLEINFNQSTTNFAFDANLLSWLKNHPQQLISAETALDHFYGSIERVESPGLNDHGRPWEDQTSEEFLNERDLNGDLALSFEEFKPVIDDSEIASITEYFNDIDIDQSQGISLDEFINDGLDGEFGDCEEHDEEGFGDEFDEDEFDEIDDLTDVDEDLSSEDTILNEAPVSDNAVAGTFDNGAFTEDDFDDEFDEEFDDEFFDLNDEETIAFLTEEFNTYDTNSDNTLVLDEWISYISSIIDEHAREEFDEIDLDTNGVLTLEELEAEPEYGDEDYDDEIFSSLDLDNSEAISLDEFLFHVDESMKALAEEHFNEMDSNANGLLTIDEVEVHRPRDSAQDQIEELEEMDLNADGFVDLDEFLADVPEKHLDRASEWYDMIDSNSDGLLTINELIGEFDDDFEVDEEETDSEETDEDEVDEEETDSEETDEGEVDEEETDSEETDEGEVDEEETDSEETDEGEVDEEETDSVEIDEEDVI
jgi:hypothetical protein